MELTTWYSPSLIWYSPSFCPVMAITAKEATDIFGKQLAKRLFGRHGFCHLTEIVESYHDGLFCEAKLVVAVDSNHYVNRAEADELNFCRIEIGKTLARNLVIFEVDIELTNEFRFV